MKEGAILSKTGGGNGSFGYLATIKSIDSPTQFTASVKHETAGSITFTVGGFIKPIFLEDNLRIRNNKHTTFNCDPNNPAACQSPDCVNYCHYDVKITDAQQCIFMSNFVQVTEPDTIEVDFTLTATSCTEAKDGEIHLDGKGGVGQLLFEWSTGATGSDISELASGEYVVKTTDANLCFIYTNITLPISPESCFKFANSFTPNGDGKNDTWMIRGIENYPEATVSILNQWGSVIFESFGYKTPWDGTYQGKALPSATYYYIIKLTNDEPALTGGVTILR
jgi:gliding motility-associated-like protein